MAKHFHCPVNATDCPYYFNEPTHPCQCKVPDPIKNCEDFSMSWDYATPEEYTDDHE